MWLSRLYGLTCSSRYLGGVLLEGGSDTTSSYLKSLHLALTAHPDAQRKAHEELYRVVGNDRLPRLDDMPKLPYIRAIIREVFKNYLLCPI